MSKEKLLHEIVKSYETMPHYNELTNNPVWLGNTKALLSKWNPVQTALHFPNTAILSHSGLAEIRHHSLETLLTEAISDLKFDLEKSNDLALNAGQTYDFFNTIRKILESAHKEVFFIDNYLSADFIERYFPCIGDDINIKLLTANNQHTRPLETAINEYIKQHEHNFNCEIKRTREFHDRFLIIDNTQVFHCSGSFKDAAKSKPTLLVEVKDMSKTILETYSNIWDEIKD